MSTIFKTASSVASVGQTIFLSQILSTSASASNPTYLVLNAFDRNEYTAYASGTTGSFSGNGTTLQMTPLGGDARGVGIVFTYQASTGRYYSAQMGYLDQLSYKTSTSAGDVTDLSLFGTSSAIIANNYANGALSLVRYDAAGYLGTLTVANVPGHDTTMPTQATPLSIAAVANSFVGQAWNSAGCWNLVSSIAALAGASLPVQSTADLAGVVNGEWFAAYNGPAGTTGNWQSSVRAGDVIGFITAAGTGHITTCVSGAGATAQLVDNTTYVNGQGQILNAANDGSSSDIIIQAAHAASQEFSGVSASSVVIYRLDTPVVSTLLATLSLAIGGTAALSTAFAATDPAGRAITSYQAYSTNALDDFTIGSATSSASSAASAVTASSLAQITFDRLAGVTDTIDVRAFNGTYWGDWTSISVGGPSVSAGTVSVFRFFNNQDGTHFFTASTSERDSLSALWPDLSYEGVGLHGYATMQDSPTAEAVYRFFDLADGTHFYTANAAERDTLSAAGSGMSFEGTSFYGDATPQSGDTAVYRFFDTAHGTHLFTQSAGERGMILASRPDLVSEGVAFYAPT